MTTKTVIELSTRAKTALVRYGKNRVLGMAAPGHPWSWDMCLESSILALRKLDQPKRKQELLCVKNCGETTIYEIEHFLSYAPIEARCTFCSSWCNGGMSGEETIGQGRVQFSVQHCSEHVVEANNLFHVVRARLLYKIPNREEHAYIEESLA